MSLALPGHKPEAALTLLFAPTQVRKGRFKWSKEGESTTLGAPSSPYDLQKELPTYCPLKSIITAMLFALKTTAMKTSQKVLLLFYFCVSKGAEI